MTATTMTMETKVTAPGAAWQERGVGGDGSAATAMAGAHSTINNILKEAAATATEMTAMTATTMTMEMKATAAAEAWRKHGVGGGGSAATAMAGAHTTINN